MNTRIAHNSNSKKTSLPPQNGKKVELRGSKRPAAEKTMANRRRSSRERKLALLQDVENLKKKLRHEENVHRALQRAFTRPLGALPRLPPYLPQYTLELLAEVAVLEEEVVRLEEQVVNFRQGLYQEAAHISSTRSSEDLRDDLSTRPSKQRHSRASSQSEVDSGSSEARPSPCVSRIASSRKFVSVDRVLVRDYQSDKNSIVVGTPMKKPPLKPELIVNKNSNSPKMQCRIVEQAQESSSGSSDDRGVDIESEANKMSQDILNCLISIFVRMSSSRGKTMDFSSLGAKAFCENNVESSFRDPYFNSEELKKRDIGTYKHLYVIEPHSIDLNRKASASFLIRRLRILLDKLASVKVDGLSHQQKLAFWINIYNSCIMNAFLEHGIPESPDMIVVQMQKATVKIGGNVLNALTIEHLILRLPYHLKYTCTKLSKNDEKAIYRTLGLEWSEPLVTFALSCGSWSSPALRVYTASQIESELEAAKRAYLQAAVGISVSNKIVVPKLLDWYLLDFAKDMDALLDWICLELPDELRNEALKRLQSKDKEPLTNLVQVMPYNFSFRYLVYR